ncbi:MAG TPA: PQQ-binding-like beta-propeller repeat protein, partial [Vicinamibacterales bacterium]|nr:PQQ-binding-like beta-propeller repeat protein [Vicinamibacterales bacterium]
IWGYGGGPQQIRYSPLTQINRDDVTRLQVAWTYDTGETGALQTQPVVVAGAAGAPDALYGYTPTHKAFALNAATGALLWTFDPGIKGSGPNRGVLYWQSGEERRVFAAADNFIYALDAATGKPIASFGSGGRIDLRENLGRDPQTQGVRLTTPGAIYQDLMIVGGRVGEGLPTSPGDIRAYDVRSGALRWSFHTIPHPGEAGYETWPKQAWEYSGGANNWPGMALDERTGLVYVPTGSAASDFYGADRLGDNRFANCLLALDAATGKLRWSFQFVRHDLWDRDPPSPPSLVTVSRDGRRIDAVAQATKQGYVFLFDRATGAPLFPITYSAYPASSVPGESASAEQPLPAAPLPFARQRLTEDQLTNRTSDAHQWALEQFRAMRSEGQFVPFSVDKPTVVFPGYDGGAEYGGQAFDPETGLYYVNANDLAWTGQLAPSTGGQSGRALYLQHCALCHRDDRAGTPPQIPSLMGLASRRSFVDVAALVRKGAGRMPGFPALEQTAVNAVVQFVMTGEDAPPARPAGGRGGLAPVAAHPLIDNSYRFTGYKKFLDPDGYPAVAPPWGTLNAIDLNTGAYAWKVPLGEYPELSAKGMKDTGSENYGGPVVTAGGLVFIAATNHDRKIRAFDKRTGALLWDATLPSSGNATPAVYESGGRQFVVIAAGGGKSSQGGPGGVYVSFALPR